MINKKGDVWVSAVLYIALSMVIITLILSAGIPFIEKLGDKNTIAQTKTLLFNLDANIETVADEGSGSTRFISPFEIGKGSLNIIPGDPPSGQASKIIWSMTTKNLMMNPNKASTLESELEKFKEGALTMWMVETAVEGEYNIYIELDYPYYLDITSSPSAPPLAGKYSLSVSRKEDKAGYPVIEIRAT